MNIQLLSSAIDEDTKVLISFDGGGARGLISVLIAEALEKEAGVPLAHGSDLMIGNSMGGLTTLLFNVPDSNTPSLPKYTARDIGDFYYKFERKVFSTPLSLAAQSLWGLRKSIHDNHNIKKYLEYQFNNVLLSQSVTPTIVTSVGIEKYVPLLLKSYRPPDLYMKDAALATTASPTKFPIARITPITRRINEVAREDPTADYLAIDGKLIGANNPVMIGYTELCDLFGEQENIQENIIVISIGTGKSRRTIYYDEVADSGYFSWAPFILSLISEMATEMMDYQMDLLLKDEVKKEGGYLRKYWRLQPTIPEELLYLDNVRESNIRDITTSAQHFVIDHEREIKFLASILAQRSEFKKRKNEENKGE